jgi:hypothetical protein
MKLSQLVEMLQGALREGDGELKAVGIDGQRFVEVEPEDLNGQPSFNFIHRNSYGVALDLWMLVDRSSK